MRRLLSRRRETSGVRRVGWNLLYLVEDSGGSGTYARELLAAMLVHDPTLHVTVFVGSTAPRWLWEQRWSSRVEIVRYPMRGVGAPWHAAIELLWLGLAARRRRLDVLHGLAFVVPLWSAGVPSIVTVHDVIWLHDAASMEPWATAVMKRLVPLTARAADRVIALSQWAAEDVRDQLDVPPEKVDVVLHGVRNRDLPEGSAVPSDLALGPGPVILCIAQIKTHKNLLGLVRAHALLPADLAAELVLVGPPTAHGEEILELAASLGIGDRVHLLGWVADETLAALWSTAACLVLPSFLEGFGLPVVEAMGRGVPVACADAASLPEVTGGAAALFDPHDPADIARTVEAVITDAALRRELVERGHARSAELTWDAAARSTLASYARAIEARRR